MYRGLVELKVDKFRIHGLLLPNAQAEGADWLAQSVPSRSEEIARTVTDNRLPSSALLGSFFRSYGMTYVLHSLFVNCEFSELLFFLYSGGP